MCSTMNYMMFPSLCAQGNVMSNNVSSLASALSFAFNYFIPMTNTTNVTYAQHMIEGFSIECRKTKTKVITLANHKEHRQYSKPIKT